MISVSNLSHEFQNTLALNNVSFEIKDGAIVGLIGPNGSGKTTLFKILAGLFEEYEGRVITSDAAQVLYLGHRYGVNDQLTPVENLKFLLNKTLYNPFLYLDQKADFCHINLVCHINFS